MATLKTALMEFIDGFPQGTEFTWTQLHEFIVIETFSRHPDKVCMVPCYDGNPESFTRIKMTYYDMLLDFFDNPHKYRGFMCSPLSNYNNWGYLLRPSKLEKRYVEKQPNGKYILKHAA